MRQFPSRIALGYLGLRRLDCQGLELLIEANDCNSNWAFSLCHAVPIPPDLGFDDHRLTRPDHQIVVYSPIEEEVHLLQV